jgi:hypothetical protein
MGNVIPGLYASTPESLGFGPSLEIRAFLLQRGWGTRPRVFSYLASHLRGPSFNGKCRELFLSPGNSFSGPVV